MEDQNQNICSKCGKAKEAKKIGSITQWISVCACDVESSSFQEDTEQVICGACGKRVSQNKSGRITQWLFKENLCDCLSPEPLVKNTKPIAESIEEDKALQEELANEAEINVSSDFPKERYKPVKVLGTGASGSVYLCRDKLLKKLVALKILHSLKSDQMVAFQQEAKATSKLKHPNIVEVLDFGATTDGAPYMVLEWFNGQSLASHLASNGPLSSEQIKQIFAKIASALDYAHSQSIYHRDLKPSNILISLEAEIDVLLIDFGVAYVKAETLEPTVFQGNTLTGTPAYMSPDLGLGYNYDIRSEVYSLGCTMFEALIGKPPFTGESAMQILSKHANDEIPEIKSESNDTTNLAKIIKRCLAKAPDDRYQSMQDLEKELLPTLSSQAESPATKELEHSSKKRKKKFRVTVFLIPILAFSMVIYMFSHKQNKVLKEKSIENKELVELPSGILPWQEQKNRPKEVFNIVKRRNGLYIKPLYFEITNEDVLSLVPKGKIFSLDLSNSNVTGDNLDKLADKEITILKLRYCPITEKGFSNIAKLTTLQRLNIRDSKVGGFTHYLTNLSNLRSIDLSNSDVSDKDILAFKNMTLFNSMNLAYNQNISGSFLASLSKLKNLASIKLQYSGVEDKYLKSTDWSNFPNLKVVQLDGCRKVPESTRQYLQKKYPHLRLTKKVKEEEQKSIRDSLRNPRNMAPMY